MRRYVALAVMLISVFAAEPVHARHGHGHSYSGHSYSGHGHGHHGHGHGHFGSWSGISFGVGYGPGIGYGANYGYWPGAYRGSYGGGYYDSPLYYGGYDPYGIYYRPYDGYSSYYLPPVFAPAELLYGPRAVQQFWGLSNRPQVIRRSDRVATVEPKVRIANPEYRRKAEQFVAQGDRLFREQKYSQALDRYKQAGETARDLAEAQWRKGHAYVAIHRYELAAASFKRALSLDPDVARDGFDLARLYGPGALVKTSHLEALAGEALVRSDSADHYFLLGIFLRYDGQAERAEKFFLRAAELAGRDGVHLAGFLPVADEVPVAARELET